MNGAAELEQASTRVYGGVPQFSTWNISMTFERWEKARTLLPKKSDIPSPQLEEAFRIVRRAAAVDTGAIENLYQVDRGFTFTVAAQGISWQAAVAQMGAQSSSLIQAQLDAYELLVDLVTTAWPVNAALVRRLHEQVCAKQTHYTVHTPNGPEQRPLELGAYKQLPNNVLTTTGEIFQYCPPMSVAADMDTLFSVLGSSEFLKAHPIVQAAYAHYAFVVIHPFQDGNGRVARLLASLFLCRAESIPFLVLSSQRGEYLASLRAADNDTPTALLRFVEACTESAFVLAEQSLRAARHPTVDLSMKQLREAYFARAGVEFAEIDRRIETIAKSLLTELVRKASQALGDLSGRLESSWRTEFFFPPLRAGDRCPDGNASLQYVVRTREPMVASCSGQIQFELPGNPQRTDTCVVRWRDSQVTGEPIELVELRIDDVLNPDSPIIDMRVHLATEQMVRQIGVVLAQSAIRERNQRGYVDKPSP